MENEEYLGGLRNPQKAVDRSPGLQKLGARLRAELDKIMEVVPEMKEIGTHFGQAGYTGPSEAAIAETRARKMVRMARDRRIGRTKARRTA